MNIIIRFLKSPFSRISFGITLLTLSIILIADVFRFFPNQQAADFAMRKVISETIAIQVSQSLSKSNNQEIENILTRFHHLEKSILSIALIQHSVGMIHSVGDHLTLWEGSIAGKSSPNHIVVAIYKGGVKWGDVQVSFVPLPQGLFAGRGSLAAFALFVLPICFVGYFIFLRRVLKELNPNAVIPQRVSSALDTLAEGLLIIDSRRNIVFSNTAFSDISGVSHSRLVGMDINALPWQAAQVENQQKDYSWNLILSGEKIEGDHLVVIKTLMNEMRTLSVNVSPVLNDSKRVRGVLVTFEDVTLMQKHNSELEIALEKIQKSQQEIEVKNKELLFLASHDPLTSLLNRRSFYENVEALVEESSNLNQPFCVVMIDIDYFKKINDNYGHTAGDKVICDIAKRMKKIFTPSALLCRYGGEEFCVVIPECVGSQVAAIVEMFRENVQDNPISAGEHSLNATVSLGIADTTRNGFNIHELIEAADSALYFAKENGRNRGYIWQDTSEGPIATRNMTTPQENFAAVGTVKKPSKREDKELKNNIDRSEVEHVTEGVPDNLPIEMGAGKLLSRYVLLDRIENAIKHAERSHHAVGILAIRITEFATVNSLCGVTAAEQFLVEAMKRLQSVLRETDLVSVGNLVFSDKKNNTNSLSRMNSDEFVVLLNDLQDKKIITVVLARIYEVLKEPVVILKQNFIPRANIGIAFNDDSTLQAEQFYANASTALCEANNRGEINAFEFHNEALREELKHKIRLESELVHAVERDEFELVFQPQFNLRTGQIRGVESLIRWNHPDLGRISPNDFIPIAENCGVINDITLWAIRCACVQQAIWLEQSASVVPVSINISAVDLRKDTFVTDVTSILRDTGVEPSKIELEVTEGILVGRLDKSLDTMKRLCDIGVHLAIDDFGVGYSNLSYITRFPIRCLKIDKTFINNCIDDVDDAAIVSAIIVMAHSLDLEVVAEGVETAEQLRFLQEMDCDVAQGYFMSKPISSRDMLGFMTDSNETRGIVLEHANNHDQGVHSQQLVGLLNKTGT